MVHNHHKMGLVNTTAVLAVRWVKITEASSCNITEAKAAVM